MRAPLPRAAPRPQVKDRHLVAQRMKAHIHSPDGATPLLIFPEGT